MLKLISCCNDRLKSNSQLKLGNIPGELIDFIGLQLFSLYLPKFAMEPEFWEEFWSWNAFNNHWRRWRWLMDAQAIPRAAYNQFIEDCYRKNLLIQNGV